MRGLVSQEQELRAVVESCLLEQDGARKDVHTQLQETLGPCPGLLSGPAAVSGCLAPPPRPSARPRLCPCLF